MVSTEPFSEKVRASKLALMKEQIVVWGVYIANVLHLSTWYTSTYYLVPTPVLVPSTWSFSGILLELHPAEVQNNSIICSQNINTLFLIPPL